MDEHFSSTLLATSDTTSKKCCKRDQHPVYPQFLYSKINHADHWNMNRFGRADYMAVYIETGQGDQKAGPEN